MKRREQHILILCIEYIPSVHVGVVSILENIKKSNAVQIRFVPSFSVTAAYIEWADIVISVRGYTPRELVVMEYALHCGKYLVYYLDDDLMNNLPENNFSYSEEVVLMCRDNIPKILSTVNILWTNSDVIVANYGVYCQNTIKVIAPAPCLATIPQKEKSDVVSIIFAGGLDHSAFLNNLLGECLIEILEKHMGKVRLYVLGAKPDFANKSKYITMIPYEPDFNKYRQNVIGLQPDIGLAPLPDKNFYHSKYFNKYLEYATMGIAGVYSKTLPYTSVVKDKVTGLLADNSPEAWKICVEQLIADTEMRINIRKNSRTQVDKEFTMQQACASLLESMPHLVSFRSKKIRSNLIEKLKFNFQRKTVHSKYVLFLKKYKWKAPSRLCKKLWECFRGS